MIPRHDIEAPCAHCGAATEGGSRYCAKCLAFAGLDWSHVVHAQRERERAENDEYERVRKERKRGKKPRRRQTR